VSYRSIKTESNSKNKSEDMSKNVKEDVKKEARDEGENQDGIVSVPASLPLSNSTTVAPVAPAAAVAAVANVQDSKASTSYSSTGQDTRISLIQVRSVSRTPIHSLIFLFISFQSHVVPCLSHQSF
jgi:hypothetical protein